MFSSIRQHYQIMKDHSNLTKMHFWMIQRAKKEVLAIFGILVCWINFILHILILLNGLNNLAMILLMLDHSKITKMHFEWSKEPKMRFLAIFWSLVCWIDLILHIVIVLNVFQLSAILLGHEEACKDHKNAFLNDPKSQKRSF